tara:strand:+ start:38 stop:313 length:276 start_codon:yes stop_codon:yes gene_type:complete
MEFHGRAMRHAVQPTSQGILFDNRSRTSGEDQKRCLKRVFGIVRISQHALADSQNHWSMSHRQRFERGFVLIFEKPLQQLLIGYSSRMNLN